MSVCHCWPGAGARPLSLKLPFLFTGECVPLLARGRRTPSLKLPFLFAGELEQSFELLHEQLKLSMSYSIRRGNLTGSGLQNIVSNHFLYCATEDSALIHM